VILQASKGGQAMEQIDRIGKLERKVDVLETKVDNIERNIETIKSDLKEDIQEVKESQNKMTYWIMGTLATSVISLLILIFNILGGK
jgi:peptidoglycan hydrolase CwlO-like protein